MGINTVVSEILSFVKQLKFLIIGTKKGYWVMIAQQILILTKKRMGLVRFFMIHFISAEYFVIIYVWLIGVFVFTDKKPLLLVSSLYAW